MTYLRNKNCNGLRLYDFILFVTAPADCVHSVHALFVVTLMKQELYSKAFERTEACQVLRISTMERNNTNNLHLTGCTKQ